MYRYLGLAVLLLAPFASRTTAADPPANATKAEVAIRASAEEFTKAFNRGDAKAIAALWTTDGKIIDEQGQEFAGQPAIEEQYAELFKANPEAQIEVTVEAVDLASPGVAIEEGFTSVAPAKGTPPTASRYRAVHVLQNGKWKMASVREAPAQVAPMQSLSWLAGKWQNKTEDTTIQSNIRWIAGDEFLQRDYSVKQGDKTVSTGTQIIGFDPASQTGRSWSFDSTGGHGSGIWKPTSEGWLVKTRGALPDGTPTASLERVIRVPGEDSIFGWQSMDRHAGNLNLADTEEIVMERVTE